MDKIVEHSDGKIYEVDTTPDKKHFATVYELLPRKASGVLANFLREQTGHEQYTYDRAILDDYDLIKVVLDLGRHFSTSKQWRRLFEWAYWHPRQEQE